jgi:hypothetical protein
VPSIGQSVTHFAASRLPYLAAIPAKLLDTLIQMAAYPILRSINPLHSLAVNFLNDDSLNRTHPKFLANLILTLPKYALNIPCIAIYEIKKIGSLFLILPFTALSLFRGYDQSQYYFVKREYLQKKATIRDQNIKKILRTH